MIKAYKIYTGSDGHTHIERGTVADNLLTNALSIRFKETEPHAVYDWHPAPEIQYVLTLTGKLEFETWLGEKFILEEGDVLIAMDTTGTGHKWQMLGNAPWKRAYVAFDIAQEINFIAIADAGDLA